MLSKGQRKNIKYNIIQQQKKTTGRKTLKQKFSHRTHSILFRMSVLKNDVNIIYETSDKLRGIHCKVFQYLAY